MHSPHITLKLLVGSDRLKVMSQMKGIQGSMAHEYTMLWQFNGKWVVLHFLQQIWAFYCI